MALDSNTNHKLIANRQGAHLTSWICNGEEQLFLSKKALFQSGKAIRGGVPIIFPQFEEFGALGRHGFARTAEWVELNSRDDCVEFSLSDNADTLAVWPHSFHVIFKAKATGNTLELSLTVKNTDNKQFSFTSALHTYFRVNDISLVRIEGLADSNFWINGSSFTERHKTPCDFLVFSEKVDRIYFDVGDTVTLCEPEKSRQIKSVGFSDLVVWNPWAEDAKGMSDFDDEEYRQMLCIEAAQADKAIQLAPQESWIGKQVITLSD